MADYAKASDWVLRLDVKPQGETTPNWLPLLKGFQTLGESRADTTSEYYYLDGFGAAETGIDGTNRSFATTGHRVYDDPLHTWLFDFDRQWDIGQRYTNYQYFNIVTGEGEQGEVAISFSSTATGAPNDRAAFGVTVSVNGTPAKYSHDLGPYTVTYDENGGTGTVTDAETYKPGDKAIIKLDDGITPPSSESFVQWNTRADGLGAAYLPGDTVALIDDITLYAIWE